MNPYKNRDLGAEYQQGIFDMLRGAKDLWLKSGMGLLNPNNPAYQYLKSPMPSGSLLDDPELVALSENLPMLDPSSVAGMTKVFHGSPHLFKNWDFSKMGSGEGAQAYGHGGYFAGNRKVGEYYADVLMNDKIIDDINPNSLEQEYVINKIKEYRNQTNASPDKQSVGAWMAQDYSPSDYGYYFNETGEYLNKNNVEKAFDDLYEKMKGRLYEIELKPDPEDFPMYDVPLKDQPMAMEKINAAKNRLEALKKERDWTLSQIQEKKKQPGYVSELPDELKWADDMFTPSEDFPKLKPIEDEIEKLESALFIVDHPERTIMDRMSPRDKAGFKTPEWKPAAEIAEAYRTIGFPGHRFLDGMSRSGRRPEKNFNYVVYPTDDPDMIKITNPPQSLLD